MPMSRWLTCIFLVNGCFLCAGPATRGTYAEPVAAPRAREERLSLLFHPGAMKGMQFDSFQEGKRLFRLCAGEATLKRKKIRFLTIGIRSLMVMKDVVLRFGDREAERELMGDSGVLDLSNGELTLYSKSGKRSLSLRKLYRRTRTSRDPE